MPRYPYRCEHCDVEVIVSKPMSEAPLNEDCPHCKKMMVRVYGSPSIKTADGNSFAPRK